MQTSSAAQTWPAQSLGRHAPPPHACPGGHSTPKQERSTHAPPTQTWVPGHIIAPQEVG
jgi:hypothetical protein